MKARVKPNAEIISAIERGKRRAMEEIQERNRRETERMAHEIYTAMISSNFEAETVVLAAVKRHFNLGEKRMRKFLKEWLEVKKEYEEYRTDDVFAHKAKQEFSEINIDITAELSSNDNLRSALRMFEAAHKPSVSDDEAELIQESFKGFKKYMTG